MPDRQAMHLRNITMVLGENNNNVVLERIANQFSQFLQHTVFHAAVVN
jgi:hypothetical protein